MSGMVALGGAAWPEKSGACLIPEGANESDYRNHAGPFAGTCLWLKYIRPNGSTNHASAVRLNSHYALTAAHIIYPAGLNETNVIVQLGNGTNYVTDPGVTRGIAEVLVHPAFVRNNHAYPDIAIVKFDVPLAGTDLTVTNIGPPSQILRPVGFGRSTSVNGPLPVQDGFMRAFNAPVMQLSLGPDGFSDVFYFAVNFSPNSGVSLNGKGLSGDSGGPVFDPNGNLVGLNSAQVGNGSPIGYTIAMRLSAIADWIATNTIVPPTLLSQVVDTNLVLSWTGSFVLQTTTNVVEPFVDLPAATSPYTNALTADPQRFFRLRSPVPAARPAALPPAPALPAPKAPRAHEVELL